jgi:uncharacterized protein (UPF0303 family)
MTLESDIAQIKTQEEKLRFAKFDEADAWALGSLLRETCAARNLPMVVDIRVAGRALFFAGLPGASPDNAEWARRKINTVMRYHKSTYRISRELTLSGQKLDEARGVSPMEIAAAGGGFPVHIIGTGVVGAMAVSGVPQREDHSLVVECLCRFLGVDPASLALGPESA